MRTYELALCGVFLALSLVVLFLASIIPGIELTILAVSGVLVMVVVSEINIRGGLLFYIAVSLLSFLMVPNKSIAFMYIFVFGIYSIIKSIIERYIENRIIVYILKLICFNLLLSAGLILFKEAFFAGIELPDLAWYFMVAGAQVMLILYDFILTYVVKIYDRVVPESIRGKRF